MKMNFKSESRKVTDNWLTLFCILVSLVGISIFIANRTTTNSKWEDDYQHNHLDLISIETPAFALTQNYAPVIGSFLRMEATVNEGGLLPNPRVSRSRRYTNEPHTCVRFANGSTYISKRRGISTNACGPDFSVHLPDDKQTLALGCDSVPDWAGYICVSKQDPDMYRKGCPLWSDTALCDLGSLEPCHPHPTDMGCAEGLQAPSQNLINETCFHSCPNGYLFDRSNVYEPTCQAPGEILPPPPCLKMCSQQMDSDATGAGFKLECDSKPETERDTCSVVPTSSNRLCSTNTIHCGEDLKSIECKIPTCPADPIHRGVQKEISAGHGVIPECPLGFHPTVNFIACTLEGWSHSNICRPRRPPKLRHTQTECRHGYMTTYTQILDVGFPPMSSGVVSSTKKTPCTPKCCDDGGVFGSKVVTRGECRCHLHAFGFEVDSNHPKSCCLAPVRWNLRSQYAWKKEHAFVDSARAVPCTNSQCSEQECRENKWGCLGYNGSHLFIRSDAPTETYLNPIASVRNAVILNYIFA